MGELRYEVRDRIAILTLNRPERRNAFTRTMLRAWAESLDTAARDDDVRVIVVTGAGDHFCSGVDLDEFRAHLGRPHDVKDYLQEEVHAVARALDRIDKPVLAAVAGAAVGAGMDMALLADLRFAGSSARFSEGYIKVGLVPGDGGAWLLPRLVGSSRALRLLWTGDFLDATEALACGLVEEVWDDAELLDRVLEFAGRVAAQPPLPVRMIKRAVRQSARIDFGTHLDLISSHLAVVTSTDDFRDGPLGQK
ncbi:enoyl-CoA hydratase/isomerase family protein [Cryptosporangium sp. NPDC051539]|uniref:enoyl-CoA hydratase/isomerase family protein n=1 Tax=Cryptosporangium sp. NPDC051539 TaxID=3363962 RepID=UPI00379F73B7